ncbi:copper resistance protein B [Sphingobium sp.]|uniref:copper resistance protein B n=1 Tax=Sphingobium sp. TaxID=1912891 RepID=UPI00338E3C8D
MDDEAMPAMDHGSKPGMARMDTASRDHATDAMPTDDPAPVGTALPAGNKNAPRRPRDHYADRTYGADAMAASRAALPADHGGVSFSQILINIAEYRARKRGGGYRWDGEAWFGGDINRLTVKSEGEGSFHGGTERAEIQALYSRAVDPYWNLQGGFRYDVRPNPSRSYATVGVEGLAPYWFEVEAALFLSDKGDVLARLEAWHDMRLTQRLILQPRVELNLAVQDMPAERIGAGLSDAELGLRLRYEVRRELAPYVGLSWERKFGDTATFARRADKGIKATSVLVGIRTWF